MQGSPDCIFLLSVKSSGSSILQRHLAGLCNARVIAKTPHNENETLFWTKAASVLGLPQHRLEKSDVPYPPGRALVMLRQMVADNAPGHDLGPPAEAAIFDAWTAVVRAAPGMLIEKSPHHLYQPSVVDLMERYADQAPVRTRFLGLIRNPTDTLYSSWRRFGVVPEREEPHWVRAYSTLRDFAERRPDLVSVVRYEDLVSGQADLAALAGIGSGGAVKSSAEPFRATSLQKWRADRSFGYTPSAAARGLARRFGYDEEEMVNPHAGPWRMHRLARSVRMAIRYRLPR